MQRYVLLLAVAVALAGCLGSGSGPAADGDTATVDCADVDGATHTITYSGDGFSPAELTIERCDTVTWESTGPSMWVASDQHPTHTDYDGTSTNQHCNGGGSSFDQCSTGGSYSFTFAKTGDWGYHNHVAAGDGGTITVQARN